MRENFEGYRKGSGRPLVLINRDTSLASTTVPSETFRCGLRHALEWRLWVGWGSVDCWVVSRARLGRVGLCFLYGFSTAVLAFRRFSRRVSRLSKRGLLFQVRARHCYGCRSLTFHRCLVCFWFEPKSRLFFKRNTSVKWLLA